MSDKGATEKPGTSGAKSYEVAQHVAEQPDEVKGVAPDFAGGDTPTPTSGADTALPDVETKRVPNTSR